MNKRVYIIALVLWAVLSFILNLLTNLVSNVLFPSLAGKPWLIITAVIVAFLISVPLSIYITVRSLSKEPDQVPSPVSISDPQQLLSGAPTERQVISQMPSKGYTELVGRENFLGEILAALRDPNGKWMIGIDGMGGIGKTALAREVADRCQKENLFSKFVWIQAPKGLFPLNNDEKGIGILNFETLLDYISRQLGILDIPKLELVEKEARVKTLLQSERVLIVLDNFETSKEPQDDIARKLNGLLNPSKVLFTSRRRFKVDLFAVHLDDLKPEDSIEFARQIARNRNIVQVANANRKELLKIAQTTGSPLALKLIVGQLESQTLERVLEQLSKIEAPDQDSDEGDYLKFYKYIFADSWRLLSENGKKLLISMAHFAPNAGGTYEAIKATSDLTADVLDRCIQELWRYSFLERGESPNLKTLRYYLHALTQYFVLSDIVKVYK